MSEQQKTKEQIRAEAEALFHTLDAEFGKKKAVKAAPKGLAVKKEPPISEGREANKLASLLAENSIWRPVATVTHVIKQICSCCQGETEVIGNVLIRFEHKIRHFTWDTMVPPSSSHALLPKLIETFPSHVEACASCTRFDMQVMPVDTTDFQLNLFK